MAYGVQGINQQSIKAASRALNKNQYDTFYFCDFHESAQNTYAEGGLVSTVVSNSGTATRNAASGLTGFGITACSGTVTLSTATTSNNNAGAAAVLGWTSTSAPSHMTGLQTPSSSSFVSKYEMEALVLNQGAIFSSSATLGGAFRCGFMDSSISASLANGVWFEYLQDGTTLDSTLFIAWATSGNSKQRFDTGMTFSANTTYRYYLGFEKDTAGNFTTTYNIKNMTTGTAVGGTASPSTSNRNLSDGSIGVGAMVEIDRQVNLTTTPITVVVDYIGVRVRKPFAREVLLGNF